MDRGRACLAELKSRGWDRQSRSDAMLIIARRTRTWPCLPAHDLVSSSRPSWQANQPQPRTRKASPPAQIHGPPLELDVYPAFFTVEVC